MDSMIGVIPPCPERIDSFRPRPPDGIIAAWCAFRGRLVLASECWKCIQRERAKGA